MTYYILIYDYASDYAQLFDSVDLNAKFYPLKMKGVAEGKNGQQTPVWGSKNVVPYLIAKSAYPTQEMTGAINEAASLWDAANPNAKTKGMQLIFEENEKDQILIKQKEKEVFEAEKYIEAEKIK